MHVRRKQQTGFIYAYVEFRLTRRYWDADFLSTPFAFSSSLILIPDRYSVSQLHFFPSLLVPFRYWCCYVRFCCWCPNPGWPCSSWDTGKKLDWSKPIIHFTPASTRKEQSALHRGTTDSTLALKSHFIDLLCVCFSFVLCRITGLPMMNVWVLMPVSKVCVILR